MKMLALALSIFVSGTTALATAQTHDGGESGQNLHSSNGPRELSLSDLANQLAFTYIARRCQMISMDEYYYFEEGVRSWIALKSGSNAADLAVNGARRKASDIFESVTAGPGGLSCEDLSLDLLDNAATAKEAYANRLFDFPLAEPD